jgi:nicotinamidase-related amidase
MTRSAVVIADMVSGYDFDDADRLAESAAEAVGPMSELIDRARDSDVELVYVNDNYGDFNATRHDLIEQALAGRHPDLVEPVLPPEDADFLLKVRHSAFYGTSLEYLLHRREVGRVVLCGQVTEQCILYTALDAYVRHFELAVVRDAVAHIHPRLADAALEMVELNMRGEIVTAGDVELV